MAMGGDRFLAWKLVWSKSSSESLAERFLGGGAGAGDVLPFLVPARGGGSVRRDRCGGTTVDGFQGAGQDFFASMDSDLDLFPLSADSGRPRLEVVRGGVIVDLSEPGKMGAGLELAETDLGDT
nr:hypothetical protein BaRGS_001207 [Batillaria attramentaria]KAG5698807.1 hypothetical protein BaRGS_019659 [Batillaria attramentaria]